MMKGTAALQVSIDYSDEEDYVKKLRVANFLSPIFAYITDNAPIFEGKTYEANSLRTLIWKNTDPARSGIIPKAMDKLFGYNDYAEYLLNIEPILVVKENEIISSENLKTNELMEAHSFAEEELYHIMTMVFPDVRSKRYIEIRTGDSMPYPYSFSYITLIKGIFYSEQVLNKLYELSQGVDNELLEKYKSSMLENGREGQFLDGHIKNFLPYLFDLVKECLSKEEYLQLAPLEALIRAGKNPSAYSKELLKKKGLESLSWCSLNGLVQEGEQYAIIGAI
jgi:glutamate--cysteine ligase